MSLPTPLKNQGSYWRTSWRDDQGKRRWATFGNAKRVKRLDAQAEYESWLAKWHADETVRNPDSAGLSVAVFVERYLAWAKEYYRRPDGTPTREAVNIEHAVHHLLEGFASIAAHDMTPSRLKDVQRRMIEADLSRKVIKQRVQKIRTMFKRAAAEELVPAEVWHSLLTVEPLKPGRSAARETEDVKPVPDAHVEKVLTLVPVPVRAMIELQLLTGMRPEEVCIMRGCDLDMSVSLPVWVYTPQWHKTQHHGYIRKVPIGPKAQAIIRPYLVHDLAAYLFCSSHHKATQPRYNPNSYYQAVDRACKRAKVPGWSPNQLRHNAATTIRKLYGLEAAKVLCGHSKVETTQIYAEADLAKAIKIAGEVG